MTAEDMLRKHNMAFYMNKDGSQQRMIDAMSEYAKEQSIAFAEFVDKYVSDDNNYDMYWDNEGEQYTRDMLYKLFSQQPTT